MKQRTLILSIAAALVLVVAAILFWRWQFPIEPVTGPPAPVADMAGDVPIAAAGSGTDSAPASSLASYIDGLGYQPLKVPRDRWGPGAVVSFDARGNENIIWFNSQCLKLSTPQLSSEPVEGMDVEVADASLPSTTLERSRGMKADVSLEKALGADVDLGAAFDDQKLRKIAITVSKVRQFVTSTGSLGAKARRLAAGSNECANDLFRRGNFIIYDALVVSDGSFQFYGSDNNLLKLDANLLSQIKAGPELTAKLVGTTSLPISAARIVGYKLLEMQPPAHGMAATSFSFREVKPAEIARLKKLPPVVRRSPQPTTRPDRAP